MLTGKEDRGPFDKIAQFAHIARPGIGAEALDRVGADGRSFGLRILAQEMFDQQADILRTFA